MSLGTTRQADDVVGLLDIGNSKTVCVVAAMPRPGRGPAGAARVLGIGVAPTRGLKAGVVVALDEAEQAVRAAVDEAERAAGVRVEDVFLGVACGRLKSSTFTANTVIGGRVVASADIERLMAAARTRVDDGRTLLHMNCISYRLDGATGIGEPLGLAGRTLGADLHAVTADEAPLRNLLHVIERAYLTTAGLAPAPYASGLGATSEEERQIGVIAIDIGAGTTTLSAFARGHLLATDVVPVGGNHVTFDIAHALGAPAYEAERIKKDCGTLARVVSDDHEVIAHAVAGEDGRASAQTTRGEVRAVIRGRMLRLFGHVAGRIERTGVADYAMQRIVLTGGGSQLAGLGEFAADFFARPVRIAGVQPLDGMPAGFGGPALAAAAGLVRVALDPGAGARGEHGGLEGGGYLQRMGQWLREGF